MPVVTGSDFLGNLVSSSTAGNFTIQTFELNPGIYESFPWLYPIANQYVNYSVVSCEIIFTPTVGTAVYNASSNPAMGYIGMRYQNDPTVPKDTTLFQVQNNQQFATGEIFKPMKFGVDGIKKALAVRTNIQPSGTDLRNYDFGYVEVFSTGLPAASLVLGTLHMYYTINFSNPIPKGGLSGDTILYCGGYVNASSSTAKLLPNSNNWTMDTNMVTTPTIHYNVGSTGTITIPGPTILNGLYLFNFWINMPSSTFTIASQPIGVSSNCTLISSYWLPSLSSYNNFSSPNAGTSTITSKIALMALISVNNANAADIVITLYDCSAGVLQTGGTTGFLLSQANPNMIWG